MDVLGTGTHTVVLAERGGKVVVGPLDDLTFVRWERVRDEISTALIRVGTRSVRCCQMLAEARTMRHEIVIYRNGVRVWEGPIVRLEYSEGQIEIEARDVLYVASRRVLSQTLNYTHPNVTSVITAMSTVMEIAYGPGDRDGWNVTPHLTPIVGPGDPRTASKHVAYATTCFDLVDRWAVYSGIDYTVLGRRIMWWDTHLKAHELPALSDAHFAESLVVSEYGSELATRSFVTNGTGFAAMAEADPEFLDYYGLIDQVVNNYEEAQGAEQPTDAEQAAMMEQARRDIENRHPAPVRLRLPGEVSLLPDTPVSINEWVPGAWVIMHATRTCRSVTQYQKVDRIVVLEQGGAETVQVGMSQAPLSTVLPP